MKKTKKIEEGVKSRIIESLTPTKSNDNYVRNEILDRIKYLTIDCPECENIIHDDEQYSCGTCNGGQIFAFEWVKQQIKTTK